MTQRFLLGFLMTVGFLTFSACTTSVGQNRIRPLLEGREWVLEPERFQQVKGEVDLELIKIVEEANSPNYYHFRALAALRLYPNEGVAQFLENYLTENKSPSHLRRALASFVHAFGTTEPERVEKAAAGFLKHADPQMRIAAARALKQVNLSTAQRLLEDYLQNEPEAWIRLEIQKK